MTTLDEDCDRVSMLGACVALPGVRAIVRHAQNVFWSIWVALAHSSRELGTAVCSFLRWLVGLVMSESRNHGYGNRPQFWCRKTTPNLAEGLGPRQVRVRLRCIHVKVYTITSLF